MLIRTYWENIYCCSAMKPLHPTCAECSQGRDTKNKNMQIPQTINWKLEPFKRCAIEWKMHKAKKQLNERRTKRRNNYMILITIPLLEFCEQHKERSIVQWLSFGCKHQENTRVVISLSSHSVEGKTVYDKNFDRKWERSIS